MMTIQPNTRLYKVVFLQTKTDLVFVVFIEAEGGMQAGQKCLSQVGVGYEILKVVTAKPGDLH